MIKFKALLLLFITLPLSAQDATNIFKKATDQLLTTNMELAIDIIEIRKNGRATEKSFNVLMGTLNDEEKIKTQILKPERSKGVTIVLTQYPDKVGLIEILTPANGKIRKMKATQKNIELVGSGSLISNYISKNHAELEIRYIKKIRINAELYHKIEVKDKGNEKHGEAEFLIKERDNHILEITSYDANSKKESITRLSNYKILGNKIHPETIITENLKDNTTTKINIRSITSKNNLKAQDFNIALSSN